MRRKRFEFLLTSSIGRDDALIVENGCVTEVRTVKLGALLMEAWRQLQGRRKRSAVKTDSY